MCVYVVFLRAEKGQSQYFLQKGRNNSILASGRAEIVTLTFTDCAFLSVKIEMR